VDRRQQRHAAGLKALALGFPGAFEDHPWGDTVVKVNKKIFVFLGGGGPADRLSVSVKLPDSSEEALTMPFTSPTGYSLGRAGWVTARFEPGDTVPFDILCDWIEESYRTVAPKKLVAELDQRDEA
jgi:predicted DNA-binding protein (MmcQ/YjbR family)